MKKAFKSLNLKAFFCLAERVGFEPTVPCSTPDFESGTFDHSATSPRDRNNITTDALDKTTIDVFRTPDRCGLRRCRVASAVSDAGPARSGRPHAPRLDDLYDRRERQSGRP